MQEDCSEQAARALVPVHVLAIFRSQHQRVSNSKGMARRARSLYGKPEPPNAGIKHLMSRPPLPPFTHETAVEKVRLAEDGWNSRDAAKVALAYTPDTRWRNRVEFATNREQAQAFLERKWNKEHEYRLIKELWAFTGNRIAVRYAYEYRDDAGQWYRAYGNENWLFAEDGLMSNRHASINEMPIEESQRLFHWPLGRRPDDHASLSDLGL
ncbi:nuclear transport factor 2 (NTF2) superfamily protein [Novosphingobium chloroacetimidivorans]|uniref:Nuclear transport factor 2 (NTF2) superfamily protein n=2 Tax=Novosphingobium chloroacetimidivorans TaxID=1428314 RepID=A0A7W7NWP0_9SPHN|nr:nuclear transport factor 2 (NTF2) superfamily protein [Novosphingobium chloroacetimidivorans]